MNTAEKAIIGLIALGAGGLAVFYVLKNKPAIAQSAPASSTTTSQSSSTCSCNLPDYLIFIQAPSSSTFSGMESLSGVDVWVDGQYVGQTNAGGWVNPPVSIFSPCKWHDVIAIGQNHIGEGKLGYFCYPNKSIQPAVLTLCPYYGVFYFSITATKPITVNVSVRGPLNYGKIVKPQTYNQTVNVSTVNGTDYCNSAIIPNVVSGHYEYTVTDQNGNILGSGSEDVCGDAYSGANVTSNSCVSPYIFIPY